MDREMIPPKLAAALAAIQGKVKAAHKSGHNKFDNYMYSTFEDYFESLRPLMDQAGVMFYFDEKEIRDLDARTTSGGKTEYVVRVKLAMTIAHSSGEQIVIEGWGEGQDRGDKAIYKAITGCKKYMVSNAFAIPTTDDPEKDSHESDGQNLPTENLRSGGPAAGGGAKTSKGSSGKTGPAQDAKAKAVPRIIDVRGQKCYNPAYQKANGLISIEQIDQIKDLRAESIGKGLYTREQHWAWLVAAYYSKENLEPTLREYLQDVRPAWFDGIIKTMTESPQAIRGEVADDVTGGAA